MDWRSYVYSKLTTDAPLLNAVPATSIYGSGSLKAAPEVRPFIVLSFGEETPSVGDATLQGLSVYVHDDPGDYLRIGNILKLIRNVLPGQVIDPSGISVGWTGDSTDLADDTYKTITRFASFTLVGRNN